MRTGHLTIGSSIEYTFFFSLKKCRVRTLYTLFQSHIQHAEYITPNPSGEGPNVTRSDTRMGVDGS